MRPREAASTRSSRCSRCSISRRSPSAAMTARARGNSNGRFAFDVAAGETYYVQAAASPNAAGGQDTGGLQGAHHGVL